MPKKKTPRPVSVWHVWNSKYTWSLGYAGEERKTGGKIMENERGFTL